ncbi:hypothetical protein HA152_07440 [Prochlorococcus marinus XMU1412]|uniref:2'-5' RNA ligase family protein n=1 Tax=Prochlorococcus marinus TaxID=1219 RepID=UPI001ADC5EE2|nr:2'-5' RNA ligase family protein [Prochlorococcus marinus]MBO8240535.1 hypothetical protein [Prochlorococcus marinus XMU1412]MBW3071770.1 hypothetical protein [Prochlorococcus marinus str. MU1412]
MRITKAFWIWGQFNAEDTKFLNLIRNKVYSNLQGPRFDVHITLAGPYLRLDKSIYDSMDNYAKTNKSINLKIKKYTFEKHFYKSIYISVENSIRLQNIRNSLFRMKKFDSHSNFDPHISLIYGSFKESVKKNIIINLPKLKNNLLINKLSFVDVNENISQWKIIENFELN